MTYFWENPTLLSNKRWSYGYKTSLPDNAFLYIDKKRVTHRDAQGRSHPLDARHFPVKNANGSYSCSHIHNAISRAPQSDLPVSIQKYVQAKARRLLNKHCPL